MFSDEYLAGLFDGEGWLSITTRRGTGQRVPECGITMTHQGIITALHAEFGGRLYHGRRSHIPRKDGTGVYKDTWAWRLKHHRAVAFISRIAPHLIVRREDAYRFLAYRPKPMGQPRFVTLDGETMNLSGWCERHGLKLRTVQARLGRGMSEREAITTPLVVGRPRGAAHRARSIR